MKAETNGKTQFAEVAGIKTRYRIRGEGFPIVIIHGLMGSIEQEDAMAGKKARLNEKYMVVHYDVRGRGRSEAGSYDTKHYTWDGLAKDLWALMQHIGIERAHLIGGSMGATAALTLAIERPRAVASMVVHNPVDVRELGKEYIDGIMDYADFIEREGMEVVTDLILNLPPNDTLHKTHPKLWNTHYNIMRSQEARVVAAATRGIVCSTPMNEKDLKNISVPALIIASEGDGLHPTGVGQFLEETIPDARGLFGPNLTYFIDNPNMVSDRILEFYTEIDGTEWD